MASDTRKVFSRECKTISQQEFHAVITSGSLMSSSSHCNGTSRSALWLPFDLFLEDAMDGSEVRATGAVETLTGKDRLLVVILN